MKKGARMKVIKPDGLKFLTQGRHYWLALLTVLLVSGCSSSPLPPVERIVMKTEIVRIAVTPPRKPNQIALVDFDHFEILTQSNIEGILAAIEEGNREPFNHVILPYNSYLDMATWMKAVENFLIAAEDYFKTVEDDYERIQEPE